MKMKVPQLVVLSIALLLLLSSYHPALASSAPSGNNGYYVGIKILGSDGAPIVGEVGSVVLNIACYGCGTLETISVANGVSDSNGVMNLQLPLGPYTMQVINPAGGVYEEFDFNVPQTVTEDVVLNVPSSTVQAALKANPINLKEFTVYNASAVTGGQVDPKTWFLPNDTFAGLYSLNLMQAMAGYQETIPIYILPYTSPPALLFALAVVMIAVEPYAAKSARKDKARLESEKSAE
jgi:hypothetical protein